MWNLLFTAVRRHWRTARYKAHLRSAAWAAYRLQVFARDGYRCRDCGRPGAAHSFECHHLTYTRLGKERLSDCITLCPPCHGARHGQARPARARR